jgi:hypothetical protein
VTEAPARRSQTSATARDHKSARWRLSRSPQFHRAAPPDGVTPFPASRSRKSESAPAPSPLQSSSSGPPCCQRVAAVRDRKTEPALRFKKISALYVTAITLALWHLSLGHPLFIRGKRPPYRYLLLEFAFLVPSGVTLIALMWFNHRSLARPRFCFCWHTSIFVPLQFVACDNLLSTNAVLSRSVPSRG